ncbi:MAG TPA: ABC transporter permease [Vicinamibacterales bacterium]|nr:ABC transporter permease [Vicinamibacterales bacterium]
MTVVVRRIASSLVMLFAVSVLSFAVLERAPGDFFAEMQADARVGSQTVEDLRAQYGLTQSPIARYWQWLRSFVQGDLGFSLAHRAPVSSVIWARAGNTLLLTIPAMLVTWCLALPLGVWIARHRNRWIDRVSSGLTSTLVAMPDLLVALLLLLLALRTGLFPTGGMRSPGADDLGFWARLVDLGRHAFLPLLALIATTLPSVVRHVRASVIEAAEAPAVQAARGYGIARSRITSRYVLPLAANPLVSLAGLSIATLLSASLLIEVVMSWPGLGPLLVEALLAKDVHVVLSASMLASALLVIGNLAADLTLYAIDPRIRV